MNFKKFTNQTVRFTVRCTNGRVGTITFPEFDGDSLIGSQRSGIHFVEDGQVYNFNGTPVEVVKVETYSYPEWVEVSF